MNKVLDKGLRTADNMSEGCTCLLYTSSMVKEATPGPVNSMLLYRAPSTPIMPMMCRIRSLPDTRCV